MANMSNVSVDTSGEAFDFAYEPPSSLSAFQDTLMVRFGHTDNITVVFDSNSGETTDYLLGLIFLGSIILAIFLIWSTALMVFMCVGHRVGFLSGHAFVRKPLQGEVRGRDDDSFHNAELNNNTTMDGDEPLSPNAQYLNQHNALSSALRNEHAKVREKSNNVPYHGDPWKSRPSRSRIIFIVSGIICLTFGILIVTQGIMNLNSTINTVDKRTAETADIADSAKNLIQQGFLDITTTASALRGILQEELDDKVFCPAFPAGTPLTNQAARDMQTKKNELLVRLDQLSTFQEGAMADLESSFQSIVDGTSNVLDYTSNYSASDWQSLVVLIPYTIFPSLLIVAAIMALFDVSSRRYTCFVTWFVMPIFIIMTVLAFVFAGTMTIMAGVNADFCLPGGEDTSSSPDELVLSLLVINGQPVDSLTYEAANFYIRQCEATAKDPLGDIRPLGPDLNDNVDSSNNFLDDLLDNGKLDEVAVFCNRDFEVLPPLMESMREVLVILEQTVARLLDLASCARIIPLYTDTVYNAGCTYAPSAIFWVFSCSVILGVFGMIMITLRASMKATAPIQDYTNHFPQSDSIHKVTTYPDDMDNSADHMVPDDDNENSFPVGGDTEDEIDINGPAPGYPPYSYNNKSVAQSMQVD